MDSLSSMNCHLTGHISTKAGAFACLVTLLSQVGNAYQCQLSSAAKLIPHLRFELSGEENFS